MEYFSLLVPAALIIILFIFFRKQTTIWEYFIPTASTILVVLCMHGCMQSSRTSDTEFLTQKIGKGCHEDPWDEKVSCRHEIKCTHPKYCKDNNGKKYQCGHKHSNDGHYHPYDVDYHSDKWYVIGENGVTIEITKSHFTDLVNKWKNNLFVDMHRRYHSINGNKQETIWPKDFESTESITWEHTYINKVQASDNIVSFRDVDTSDIRHYELFEYPKASTFNQKFILANNYYIKYEDQELLKKVNAHLGTSKQCQVFLLIFKDKDYHSAELQKQYWKGGNKNEFIICIGVDSLGEIQWNYNFTWSESTICEIEIREFIMSQKKLDISKTLNYSFTELNKNFTRKHFKDFDYLKIELTHGQINSIYITIVIINILMGIWIVLNDFKSESTETKKILFRRDKTKSKNKK